MQDRRIAFVHVLLFKTASIKSFPPFSFGHLLTVTNNLQVAFFFQINKKKKRNSLVELERSA